MISTITQVQKAPNHEICWKRSVPVNENLNFNFEYLRDGSVRWLEKEAFSPTRSLCDTMSEPPHWLQAQDRASLIIKAAKHPEGVQKIYTNLKKAQTQTHLVNINSVIDQNISPINILDTAYRLFEIFRMINANEKKQSYNYGAAGGRCPNLGAQSEILKSLDAKIIELGGKSMLSKI